MKRPLVSVVIPFLNAQRFLGEAVESVLAQSFRDWELILVDDGSSDGGERIAAEYTGRDPLRIRYVTHSGRANRGISASRNLGVEQARGEFVAFLDADDRWLPCKLERQVALLLRVPEAAMVFGSCRYWYSWTNDPADLVLDYVPPLGLQTERLYWPPDLLLRCYPLGRASSPPPSDILVRSAALRLVGGFEDAFARLYEDQAFFAKLYLQAPVYVSREEWVWYRIHPDSWSARAVKAGEYRAVRRFYLEWLTRHLEALRVRDPRVWKALHAACAAESHPRLSHFIRGVTTLGSRIRSLWSLISQGALHAHLRRRRWLQSKSR